MENEKRLIADALKKYHDSKFTPGVYEHSIFGKAAILLEADAVPVVHGHWTSTGIFSKRAGYGVRYYQHAECGVAPCRLFECEHEYCPNCGAKMDGGNEDEQS